VNGSLLRTTVAHLNAHADVFRAGFGVLDKHVKVALSVEDARVHEFVLCLRGAALAALLDELLIGIGSLRILVEVLHVRMRWRGIEVEIILLHILAMVGLGRH
jgi:hypothetical protein